MGALFGNLTRSGIGDSVGSAKYFDSPEEAVSFGSKKLASQGFGAPSVGLSQGAPTVTPGAPAPDEDPMMIQPNQQGQFRAQNMQQQDVLPPNLQSNDSLALSSPSLSGVKPQKPSFAEAASSGKINSAETKGGKLLHLLTAGLKGALAGDPRTAQGYQQAVRMPGIQKKEQLGIEQDQLQNEALKAQAQYAPMLTALGIREKQAEIKKSEADVANLPADAALKQAQANAAKFKEVGGVLYDLTGAQPQAVQGAGMFVPADEEMSAASGLKVGTKIPLELATKLKGFAGENTPFKLWHQQHPNEPIENFLKLGPEARAQFVTPAYQPLLDKDGQIVAKFNNRQGTVTPLANPLGVRKTAIKSSDVVPVADPKNPGNVIYARPSEALAGGATPAQKPDVQKAMQQSVVFQDIDRVVGAVDKNVGALDQPWTQKALMANALSDPANMKEGALKSFASSVVAKKLSSQSRDYVNSILSLREQVMGLNRILTGSGGISDSRTQAIWDTIPGAEPDSDNARRKMELAKGMINNLRGAVPQIPALKSAQQNQSQQQNKHSDLGFVPLHQ